MAAQGERSEMLDPRPRPGGTGRAAEHVEAGIAQSLGRALPQRARPRDAASA